MRHEILGFGFLFGNCLVLSQYELKIYPATFFLGYPESEDGKFWLVVMDGMYVYMSSRGGMTNPRVRGAGGGGVKKEEEGKAVTELVRVRGVGRSS